MADRRAGESWIARPAPIVRWVVAPFLVVVGVLFGIKLLGAEFSADRWAGVGFIVGFTLFGYWSMFYARVELRAECLVIVNVIPRKVAYGEIVDVETPPFRDMIIRTESRTYRSFALAKDNVSRLLGRRARADEVADEIRRRARAARS